MISAENLRYSCQLTLPGFTETSQERLRKAKVLVVGAGGLGCPAAQYLAAAGIGCLGIADFDTVSISNLHRQILFTPEEVGQAKAEVAARKLQTQNPQISIEAHRQKITSGNVFSLVQDYDLVVDCTDNFESRYLLNDACVLIGKPLVYGAIFQFEGQVAVWNVANADGTRTPNYRDLFPEVNASQIPNCADGGVIPTIAGIIGVMMANEVLKYFSGTGELLTGKVLLFDAFTMQSRTIKLGQVTKAVIQNLPVSAGVSTVSVSELKRVLAEEIYELIDIRTIEERAAFHIGGYHIALTELEENRRYFAEKSKPVLLYCASGKRSENAVKILQSVYPQKQFFSLAGGLKAWQEQN
jgi:molybdopterin/thiamine biosynthesis adenylyltransferase/rhodanese-related sulfurtransferase